MYQENASTEVELQDQTEVRKSAFTTVTPFSKFAALFLFIVMPFFGFWLGYTYAPTEIVEVTKEIDTTLVAKSTTKSETTLSEGEDVYDWCMNLGGTDRTLTGFNTFPVCVLHNKVFTRTCVSNDAYVVIQDDQNYKPNNFLVKSKTSPEQPDRCDYTLEEGDFEIQNEGADRLFALAGDYLLISSATGPGPAGLTVYDLRSQATVHTDTWLGPSSISDTILTYWTPTTIEATPENCNSYDQNQTLGLSSAIDEQVSLDLESLVVTPVGVTRCSERQ